MSDTEGDVKNVEQAKGNEKAKGDNEGVESDVEIVDEDNTANQYFDFAFLTRGWAVETANRLGLPDNLVNFNLASQPRTPASIPRNWMPQHRITIKGDGSCFFRSSGHVLCGKDSGNEDAVQLHTTVLQ